MVNTPRRNGLDKYRTRYIDFEMNAVTPQRFWDVCKNLCDDNDTVFPSDITFDLWTESGYYLEEFRENVDIPQGKDAFMTFDMGFETEKVSGVPTGFGRGYFSISYTV